MAPKKKTRNSKAKKSQEETPRPLSTIPCQKCGEDITVPKTCRHGKKLINCQGTGCTTAHIEDHNARCTLVRISKPTNAPMEVAPEEWTGLRDRNLMKLSWSGNARRGDDRDGSDETGDENNDKRVERRVGSSATMNPERLRAMGTVTAELNSVIKVRGGKPVRYLEGVPFTEWYSKLGKGPIRDVNEWVGRFRDVADGKRTVEEIGYDDEESEDEGDACPTPPGEDEGDIPNTGP